MTEPSGAPLNGKLTLLVWLVGLLLAVQVFSLFKPAPKWEYTVTSVDDTKFTEEMNKMGQDGWELVFARRASSGSDDSPTFSYEVIFKRPLTGR